MESTDFLAVLEKLRAGYNQMDVSALEGALAENVRWDHRNHWKAESRAEVIRMMKKFIAKMPTRYFGDVGRFAINGDIAIVEQKWFVTPEADEPSWGAKKGVLFSMDMCSVFVLQGGKIVEWSDYA